MTNISTIAILICCLLLHMTPAKAESGTDEAVPSSVLDFNLALTDGTPTPLENFRGKVLLLVNVASKCGFTGQYDGLQKLQEQYESQGFSVLGFPANNFLGQEPGTNAEIAEFCRLNYGVSFPVFAKISVKGSDQHPLYKFLTEKATNPDFSGKISWNFNKFLINRSGKVVARFGSMTSPQNKKLIAALEKALAE